MQADPPEGSKVSASCRSEACPAPQCLPLRRLDRRVALVTGGGSGAGAAIARRCAQLGASVVVADIDYALAGEVAATIRASGSAALAHRCDVAQEEQVAAVIDRTTREFGGLDLVFNVAGPWLDDDPLSHWSRIVGTNLLGTMHVTRRSIEILKRRGGSIVNVAAAVGAGLRRGDPAGLVRGQGRHPAASPRRCVRCRRRRSASTASRRSPSAPLDDFAAAAVNLSLREDYAGRVFLYRAADRVEIVDYGDPGYRQSHPLEL